MRIISIVLETKQNGEEALRHLGVFQCVKTPSTLFATLARQKFQGAEVVQSHIQLKI